MAEVAATMKVLESDQQALFGGEPQIDENEEEFVEIEDDETASELDEKPAAKVTAKPAAKPVTKAPAVKAPVEKPAAAVDDDSALPEPLRGKSRAEIARMYSEAHQTIGRQGSELGEFRRKADLLIQASLTQLQAAKKPAAEPAKPEEIDDSEFFANPKEAIRKAVENHPLVKQLKESQGNLAADQQRRTMETNAERFNKQHPDAGEILQKPEFRAWVEKSQVRRGLLQRAHERYDFAAGDEVFSTWKELEAARKPAAAASGAAAGDGTAAAATNPTSEAGRLLAAAAKAKRAAAAAEAAAPTGGGGTAAAGKKKVYRRADILKLMETDPERYAAMADEIQLAYAEKRVR